MSAQAHLAQSREQSSPQTPHEQKKSSYKNSRSKGFESAEKYRSLEMP